MGGMLNRLLRRYDDQAFVIRLKARFIAHCYLAELVAILLAIVYAGYAHLHNPLLGYALNLDTLGVLTVGFALSLLGFVILVRGHFTLAANLLLVLGFAIIWTVIFVDRTHILSRLDTIVLVIALLAMTPIVVLDRTANSVFYAAINILVLFTFMFLSRDELELPYSSFVSYLSDNTVAILVVTLISYQVYSINRRALEKTEHDIRVRKRAEADLTEAQQRYLSLFESRTTLVFVMDGQGRFVEANDLALKLLEYSREELPHLNYVRLLHPDQPPRAVLSALKEIWETGAQAELLEIKLRSKTGKTIYIQTGGTLIPEKREIIGVARDITDHKKAEVERKRLEDQLVQAQKMEAVGTLAGGIAHDFNNSLQGILGYTQILLLDMPRDAPEAERLLQIEASALRASELTQQLLTFSRRVESRLRPVDLNQEVRQAQRLWKRTIPKMIDVELRLDPELGVINADPVQVEQVMMNLVVNARDAMPHGGKLTIETGNATLDEACCTMHLGAIPGAYVMLSLSDNGEGMEKETVERIFEPFFTTKPPGEGTGLGLSMVYGIVKNHRGFITCDSEPGKGTTFRVCLPMLEGDGAPVSEPRGKAEIKGGTETLLLVEDEEAVRGIAEEMLGRVGYTVLTATNGEEALETYRERRGEISLVILDLIMPGLGGGRCLEEILRMDPSQKVVIASGLSVNGSAEGVLKDGAKAYIGKPYELASMLAAVRRVLDGE